MAIPLFHFKADPRDSSGVELNLGDLGSVLSTATNLDHLKLTASALNFSNGSQLLTLSKGGISSISNDLNKTISLFNGNVSTGLYFKDFTNNTSFPAKSDLTPLGMTIYSEGVSGNSVQLTSSALIVGGTSVSWSNVIATGAELQNIEALIAPPNASTLTIDNTLQVKNGPTGDNRVTTLVTDTESSITLRLSGFQSTFNQDSINIQTPSGSGNYSSFGMLLYGNDGTRLRFSPDELSNLRTVNYSISSAGALSLSSATTLNMTTPVVTLTGPTLLDSLVTPMVVTTKYLPITIGGTQYYLSLSSAAP